MPAATTYACPCAPLPLAALLPLLAQRSLRFLRAHRLLIQRRCRERRIVASEAIVIMMIAMMMVARILVSDGARCSTHAVSCCGQVPEPASTAASVKMRLVIVVVEWKPVFIQTAGSAGSAGSCSVCGKVGSGVGQAHVANTLACPRARDARWPPSTSCCCTGCRVLLRRCSRASYSSASLRACRRAKSSCASGALAAETAAARGRKAAARRCTASKASKASNAIIIFVIIRCAAAAARLGRVCS